MTDYAPPQAAGFSGQQPQGPDLAGWWTRFGASILDSLVMLIAAGVVGGLAYAAGGEDAGYLFGGLVYFAMLFLYQPLMLARHEGQTLGKQAVGIRVVRHDSAPVQTGQSFGRELTRIVVSFVPLGSIVDGLWAAFHKEKRSLHDLAGGTIVVNA